MHEYNPKRASTHPVAEGLPYGADQAAGGPAFRIEAEDPRNMMTVDEATWQRITSFHEDFANAREAVAATNPDYSREQFITDTDLPQAEGVIAVRIHKDKGYETVYVNLSPDDYGTTMQAKRIEIVQPAAVVDKATFIDTIATTFPVTVEMVADTIHSLEYDDAEKHLRLVRLAALRELESYLKLRIHNDEQADASTVAHWINAYTEAAASLNQRRLAAPSREALERKGNLTLSALEVADGAASSFIASEAALNDPALVDSYTRMKVAQFDSGTLLTKEVAYGMGQVVETDYAVETIMSDVRNHINTIAGYSTESLGNIRAMVDQAIATAEHADAKRNYLDAHVADLEAKNALLRSLVESVAL